MKFYYYTCDADHYGYMRFTQTYTHENGFPISGQFDKGQSISSSWQPATMEANTSQGPLSDFPVRPMGPPILSCKAWNVLQPLISGAVKALPVETPSGTYLALNVLDIIDCLDYEKSEFTYYPASMNGGIHRMVKCQLDPSLIGGRPIFKIPERMTQAIVSEEFKDKVTSASLKGLDFSQVLYETEIY